KIIQSANEIFSVRLECCAQDFRIGEDEIGWGKGVGELLGIKLDAAARFWIEPFYARNGVLKPIRGQKVRLLDEVEYLVFLPLLVAKAFVAGRGRDYRLCIAAHHASRGAFPKIHVVAPERELRLHDRARIGDHPAQQIHEGTCEIERVEWLAA